MAFGKVLAADPSDVLVRSVANQMFLLTYTSLIARFVVSHSRDLSRPARHDSIVFATLAFPGNDQSLLRYFIEFNWEIHTVHISSVDIFCARFRFGMTLYCCNPKCWKGAHAEGPLSGFCCGKCILTVFSRDDFEQVGGGHHWYKPGKNHYKSICCQVDATVFERAKRPLLTAENLDKVFGGWNSKAKSAAA